MGPEDREIVERVLAGDERAFEALVRKYNRLGGAVAYGVLGDYQLAEDAVQESFLKAYRSLGALRDPSRFRAWFAGIVRSCSIDELRRRRSAQGRQARPEGVEDPIERVAAPTATPEEQLLGRERLRRVLDAVAALAGEDRLVFVLKHMEGLSYREIAEVTETTVSAVESRLFRARRALREALGRHSSSDSPGS